VWTRNWDAQTGRVLMPQQFSDEDDLAHIRWLLKAFADDRYIKIDGRPLMLIYRPAHLPDSRRTAEIWRTEAQKAGFPDLYLCWVESWGQPPGGPGAVGLDATVGFMPSFGEQLFTPVEGVRGHRILDYESSATNVLLQPRPAWKRFPSVMVGWDNTARRPYGATIFTGATPEAYGRWLERTVTSVSQVREEENYLFILAWNEWAEGNHLEPDQRFGRAFLEATRAALLDSPCPVDVGLEDRRSTLKVPSSPTSDYSYVYPYEHDSAVANAAALVRELIADPHSTVVDLGAGSGIVSHALREAGLHYLGLEIHPVAVDLMESQGINAKLCDLTDLGSVEFALEEAGDVGALMLLDVTEHLVEPQQLLAALSAWALKHGNPMLVVSVPNVAHFDVGLRLLSGRWSPTLTGLLDSTHLRFFTEETLERMLGRCGWEVIARDDLSTLLSDQYDPELTDALPVEMVGALRTLADTFNPTASVQRFVWAVRPVPVTSFPTSYLEAVDRPDDEDGEEAADVPAEGQALRDYLVAVGLIATETSRRSVVYVPHRDTVPTWKRKVLRTIDRSPRAAALFKSVYGRIR
jgi:2-polyprenyl-3-methyl-5-hydroxy-6-metoxy-1,4-benzoquinol methylase